MLWLAGIFSGPVLAQLRAGDVAILAYNTDTIDSFAWVTFREIPPNTPIHFTNSAVSNGWFRWGDHLGRAVSPGPLTWVSSNSLAAGSVVTWIAGTQKCWSVGSISGGGLILSSAGDQIIAYTGVITNNASGVSPWLGDPSGAVMLFGLNFANNGWDNVTGGGNTSFVPPGLSESAMTALHAGSWDNGYYDGTRTGKVAQLRRSITVVGNWNSSADYIDTARWPNGFFVKQLSTLILVQ
jgi:hypothetical protein